MIITVSCVMWSLNTWKLKIVSNAYMPIVSQTITQFIFIQFSSLVDLNNLNNTNTNAICVLPSTVCYCICFISSRTESKLSFRERIIIVVGTLCAVLLSISSLIWQLKQENKTKQRENIIFRCFDDNNSTKTSTCILIFIKILINK